MQKVLLLAIFLTGSFIKDTAAKTWQGGEANYILHDSLIKGVIPADPKEGFKDLFVRTTAKGLNVNKLNPLALNFVQDYMNRYSAHLYDMKGWGKPYFDLMNGILTQHGLPNELKYLSVIESNLHSYAVSWAGAVGPWQFMPETARNMGLRVNSLNDERTDFFKSTHAAARYLTQLYGLFGDWLLVIAAYNGGPGNVYSAMRRSGSRNFWDLQYYLPEESRNHVKKFIATHYIMEGDGGVTTLTKKERENFMLNEALKPAADDDKSETMNVSGKYNSLIIAQVIQIDLVAFNRLNPNFDKLLSANGSYDMRLPSDKMLLFQANKPQILEQSIRLMLTMDGR
ncbi:lytic transglycosylase domain-containing protein [Chitinophagaceae bacterium LB-8]|uniref:Lytic transglycosylase domain-containing protein n=1 Tax=Paraflavisolibacter caeni TaxID=2982496 RepID=A0A9X3B6Z8_9BACT|nr:lytic transglycosylase domain-containing protein [Paraflavisolibacter caeni]MCU7547956.1 lytic transglycosylase domain-containing protein [Paraflavisolibacter caeni]